MASRFGRVAVRDFAEVTPQEAAKMMILPACFGFIGRLSFSFFSELMGGTRAACSASGAVS